MGCSHAESFGEDAVALGLFDMSPCAVKLRADLLATGELVAKTAGPMILDAVSEFARCSLGLPSQKAAAEYVKAYRVQSTGNPMDTAAAAHAAAYAAWKPPAKCLGTVVTCMLTGGSWTSCLTSVVACVLADLKTQFGGKIGDLLGRLLGGGSAGGGLGGLLGGGTVTGGGSGPGLVVGGRPQS